MIRHVILVGPAVGGLRTVRLIDVRFRRIGGGTAVAITAIRILSSIRPVVVACSIAEVSRAGRCRRVVDIIVATRVASWRLRVRVELLVGQRSCIGAAISARVLPNRVASILVVLAPKARLALPRGRLVDILRIVEPVVGVVIELVLVSVVLTICRAALGSTRIVLVVRPSIVAVVAADPAARRSSKPICWLSRTAAALDAVLVIDLVG